MKNKGVSTYRGYLLSGFSAGLIAGAFMGLAEAFWLRFNMPSLNDFSAFWWGPLVYGILFAILGIGLGVLISYTCLILGKPLATAFAFGHSFGAAVVVGGCVVALPRFVSDILQGAPMIPRYAAGGALITMGAAIFTAIIGGYIASYISRRRFAAPVAVAVMYACPILIGAVYAAEHQPETPAFTPAANAAGPNVILIAADALRADYLKMYDPAARANTPQLDKFANDTVFFQSCYSQASWTKPSFATIFTSCYPGCHGATGETSALSEGAVTFPQLMQTAGYYTKGFANNPNIGGVFQFNQGFSDYVDLKPRRYFGAGASASKLSLYDVLRRARHYVISKTTDKMNVLDYYQPAENVTAEAINWLDGAQRPQKGPFFLFLHYMDAHDPFMDHNNPGVGYARVKMDNPDAATFLEPMRNAYISEIEYMDGHIGALLDALRQRGLYDNSLIIFTADHGEEFYDHNGWWHGRTLYDELTHVPLLIKMPANNMAGGRNAFFARHIDIGPTILQLAGIAPDKKMQGKSLFTSDGQFANADIDTVYAETDFENNIVRSVRTMDFKVIKTNEDNPRKLAPAQAYDLNADPREQKSINDDPRAQQLRDTLNSMVDTSKNCGQAPATNAVMSDEQKQQLEGLGYLGN